MTLPFYKLDPEPEPEKEKKEITEPKTTEEVFGEEYLKLLYNNEEWDTIKHWSEKKGISPRELLGNNTEIFKGLKIKELIDLQREKKGRKRVWGKEI